MKLHEALNHPTWKNHTIGKEYSMDGVPGWRIAYYPIFEDGKTHEVYDIPKALVEKPSTWRKKVDGNVWITVNGTDFREVPLDFLERV